MILNSWMHVKLDDFEVTDRARFFSRYQPRFQIVDYLALKIRRYELGSIYPKTQSNIAEDLNVDQIRYEKKKSLNID